MSNNILREGKESMLKGQAAWGTGGNTGKGER